MSPRQQADPQRQGRGCVERNICWGVGAEIGQPEAELEGSSEALSSVQAEVGAGARNVWGTGLACSGEWSAQLLGSC